MSTRYAELTEGRQTPISNLQNPNTFAFRILPPAAHQFVSREPINIWTYDKGSFERIIFDWPHKISYTMERQGDQIRVVFEAPANLKISSLAGEKLRNVSDAQIYRGPSETVLTLDIPADRYVHDFTDGNQIILDVVNPQIAKAPSKPVQLASYPVPAPQPQIITRSLPDIFASTLRIIQRSQPRSKYGPRYRATYREVRLIHQPTRWQRQRRHRR